MPKRPHPEHEAYRDQLCALLREIGPSPTSRLAETMPESPAEARRRRARIDRMKADGVNPDHYPSLSRPRHAANTAVYVQLRVLEETGRVRGLRADGEREVIWLWLPDGLDLGGITTSILTSGDR